MRILAVDDEFVALAKMKTMLSEIGDCDTAKNGKQALKMHAEAISNGAPYNLLTIDIDMPGMTGFELLEHLKGQEERLKINPANKFMITAGGTFENVFKASDYNISAFIVKPVKREVLYQKLFDKDIISENEFNKLRNK